MPDFTSLQLPVWAIVLLMVLAWLSREGIGAYLKWRATRMEEKKQEQAAKLEEQKVEDQRGLAGYIELIGELKANQQHMADDLKRQGEKYEQAMSSLRAEHVACLEAQAELRATNAMLKTKTETLEADVKSLREWRHEQEPAQKEHVAGLQEKILTTLVEQKIDERLKVLRPEA